MCSVSGKKAPMVWCTPHVSMVDRKTNDKVEETKRGESDGKNEDNVQKQIKDICLRYDTLITQMLCI